MVIQNLEGEELSVAWFMINIDRLYYSSQSTVGGLVG
jgi:hypothetical protein